MPKIQCSLLLVLSLLEDIIRSAAHIHALSLVLYYIRRHKMLGCPTLEMLMLISYNSSWQSALSVRLPHKLFIFFCVHIELITSVWIYYFIVNGNWSNSVIFLQIRRIFSLLLWSFIYLFFNQLAELALWIYSLKSHRTPCSEGSHAWFNSLKLPAWNLTFWTRNPKFSFLIQFLKLHTYSCPLALFGYTEMEFIEK